MRVVKIFLRFLWDFFIGDTPELFVGALLVIGFGWFSHQIAPSAGIVALPVGVAVVLTWSLSRSRRR